MKPRPRFSKRLYRPLREKLKEPVKRTFRKYPGILHRLRRIDQQVMVGPERDVSVRSSRTGWRSPRPFGVNVAGYISGEFGVAEVARGSIRALQAVGIAHILNNVETEVHRHADPTFTEVSPTNPYRINLVHVNADQAHEFYRQKGWEYFQDRQTIATWFWELSDFPEKWHDSFRYYQEIWVASPFCQQSIAKASPIPVIHMTFPVLVDDQEAQRDRTHFSLPEDTFIYLFHFDFLSIFERKNPLALIEAFRLAFEDRTDALLVIKTINSDGSPEQRAQLQDAAQGMNVHFIDGHINRAEMLRLMASSDSFVSLHRSEGLGLGMARSMYLGKPVIATGYSGNMAFMNQNNSFPVRYRLVELERDYGPYEQGMVWADPDIEHAAEFMQMVYQNRTLAEERAARGAEDIKKQMSPEAAGREMVTRLRLIAGFSP